MVPDKIFTLRHANSAIMEISDFNIALKLIAKSITREEHSMRIFESRNGDTVTLRLRGRLEVNTAPYLREAMAGIDPEKEKLVLDLSELEYISAAGVRELMICQTRMGEGRMDITKISRSLMEVFELTGFDNILPVSKEDVQVPSYMGVSFKSLLERKATMKGDKVVLVDRDSSWTWSQINKCAQIMAVDLSYMGIKKGTRVGLCGANSVGWIICFFALQKLGAMTVLLNFAHKPAEIARISGLGDIEYLCYGQMTAMTDDFEYIKDVRACDDNRILKFFSIQNPVLYLQRLGEYEIVKDYYHEPVDADMPSVMLYTSGSTGTPKGVMLSSYNLLRSADVSRESQQLTEDDRLCQAPPLFHIFGLVFGLLSFLLADAKVYLPESIHSSDLIRTIEENRCTVYHAVPTMMLMLLESSDFKPEKVASVRCSMLAGAPTSPAQMKHMQEMMPGNHFMHVYGLSEIAPATITEYGDIQEHLLDTVGKPVICCELMIRDINTGKECAPGEVGEILIKGFNMMLGYYKLPYSSQPIDEDGWLRSGDLGTITEDGYLTISGRLKELIIRGGENIMPNEIADAVVKLDAVKDVKVVGVPSEFYGEEVAACIRLQEGAVFDEDEARKQLAEDLAKYKIPSYFFCYDSFPTLPSGKMDSVRLKKEAAEKAAALGK